MIKNATKPVDFTMNGDLRERVSRQMQLREIGEEGQKAINKAHFLVIGAGGLGSPAIMY